MQQLRFVGVHDDGQHLVLETPDGEQRFSAPIDAELRGAVVKARRVNPVRGLSGNGVFGPRDIQTRFRQGASVDEIVAESGWKPERVRRYEWPILAERSHVVAEAQAVAVTPLHTERTAASARPSLHDQVVAVREAWGFAEGEAQWNSWQREDGQWNVSVSVDYSPQALARIPEGSEFPARFVYNPANQSVTAANAVAEFLLGREPQAAQGAEAPVGHRSDAARPGEEEPALQAVPAPEADAQDELLEELEARRGTRAGADAASDARVHSLTERLGTPAPEEPSEEGDARSTAQDGPETEADANGGTGSDAGAAPRGGSKRPSVPSWDDIVFGSRH